MAFLSFIASLSTFHVPFIVGTLDQYLFSLLDTNEYDFKRLQLVDTVGGGEWNELREQHWNKYITICKIDSQWEFAVWHRELTHGAEKPGGLPPLGSHRIGHDWSDLAAAAVMVDTFTEWIEVFTTRLCPTSLGCLRALGLSFLPHNSKFPLAIYFTYGNAYVSMLLSQFVPPSSSPTVPTSLHIHCCCC